MASGFSEGIERIIIQQNPPPPKLQDVLEWMSEKLQEMDCSYQAVILPEVELHEIDLGDYFYFTIRWYCGADLYQPGALHYTHAVEQIETWPDDLREVYQSAKKPHPLIPAIGEVLDIRGFVKVSAAFRYHHYYCLPEERDRILLEETEALKRNMAEAVATRWMFPGEDFARAMERIKLENTEAFFDQPGH